MTFFGDVAGQQSRSQVHNVALFVAEDLYFDVLGALDVAFKEYGGSYRHVGLRPGLLREALDL